MTHAWDNTQHTRTHQQQKRQHQRPQICYPPLFPTTTKFVTHPCSPQQPSVVIMSCAKYNITSVTYSTTSPYETLSSTCWPLHHIQTLLPGIVHTFASLNHYHILHLEYMFPAPGSTMYFGRNFGWFSFGLSQNSCWSQFCSAYIIFCLFFLGTCCFQNFWYCVVFGFVFILF